VRRGGLPELDDSLGKELHVFSAAARRHGGVLEVRMAVHGVGEALHDDVAGRADRGGAPLQALLSEHAGSPEYGRAGSDACEAHLQSSTAVEEMRLIQYFGHGTLPFCFLSDGGCDTRSWAHHFMIRAARDEAKRVRALKSSPEGRWRSKPN